MGFKHRNQKKILSLTSSVQRSDATLWNNLCIMGESWKISSNSPPTIWELVQANLQGSCLMFLLLSFTDTF